MRIYLNDLKPDLEISLFNDSSRQDPMDLSSATAVTVIGKQYSPVLDADAVLFSRTVTGDNTGVITMPWVTGDTAVPGDIVVEVEITWPDNKRQTVRPASRVYVIADLA